MFFFAPRKITDDPVTNSSFQVSSKGHHEILWILKSALAPLSALALHSALYSGIFPLRRLIARKKRSIEVNKMWGVTIEIRRSRSATEIENRRFYSGIMPSTVRVSALPMQVFEFPANGKRTCEREIDRARFGSLDMPRKFATDTWRHYIARPLDPRKVPGVTRYAAASTQRRDSPPISHPLDVAQ